MAEEQAQLDDPVDVTVDADDLGVHPPEPVAAARLDHDYGDPGWSEPSPQPFDAFNASTWNFRPVPPPSPWYRTGHSGAVLAALSVASVALVVSVVLLAFRGSGTGSAPVPQPDASTAPTTATAVVTSSADTPPPPPPPVGPPPPPPPTVAEITNAPTVQRTQQPTRKPEINVTRTPMSVHPQMPGTKRP